MPSSGDHPSRRRAPAVLGAAAIVLGLASAPAQAAPGQLDPAFGTGGVAQIAVGTAGSDAGAVARNAAGTVVLAGRAYAQRIDVFQESGLFVRAITAGGAPVPGFGTDGTAVHGAGGTSTILSVGAAAVLADGSVLVGFTRRLGLGVGRQLALMRLTPSGAVDPTFGTAGTATVRELFTDAGDIHAITLQPDGKIILAGHASGTGLLTRLTASGALDGTFGTGGNAPNTGAGVVFHDVAVQIDGRVVAAGTAPGPVTRLHRVFSNGVLDDSLVGPSATGDGRIDVSLGSPGTASEARALVILPTGNIAVAGRTMSAVPGVGDTAAIALLTASGGFVGGFGTAGTVAVKTGDTGLDHGFVSLMAEGTTHLVAFGSRVAPNPPGAQRLLGARVALTDGTPTASWVDGAARLDRKIGRSLELAGGSGERTGGAVAIPGGFAIGGTFLFDERPGRRAALLTTDAAGLEQPVEPLAVPGARVFPSAIRRTTDGRISIAGSIGEGGRPGEGSVVVDGSAALDPTAPGGAVRLSGPLAEDVEHFASAIGPDGSAVTAGRHFPGSGDLVLARTGPDGALDPSFDGPGAPGDGRFTLPGSSPIDGHVAIDAAGAVVVASSSFADATQARVLRLGPDGAPDATFGVGGEATIPTAAAGIRALATDPARRPLLVVRDDDSESIVRLTAAGGTDATFGAGGRVTLPQDVFWQDAAVGTDGAILVAGEGLGPSTPTDAIVVARLTPSGALDTGFGSGGTAAVGVGPSIGQVWIAGIDTAGRVLVAASPEDSGRARVAVARLTQAGAPDPSFGAGDGLAGAALGPADSLETGAVGLDADGSVLVAAHRAAVGPSAPVPHGRLVLVRVLGGDRAGDVALPAPAPAPAPPLALPPALATPPPTAPPSGGSAPRLPRAAVLELRLSRTVVRPQRRGGATVPRGGATRLTYRANRTMTVRFRFERVRTGRRSAGVCRLGARRGTRCTRVTRLKGSFTRRVRAGRNAVRLSGRLGGRRLSPGRYRLVLTPTGGQTRRVGFRVR